MTAPDDQILDEYTQSMADGDFVQEFQEGTNRGKYMTPDQMLKLVEAREAARAHETRRKRGIFRRVVD